MIAVANGFKSRRAIISEAGGDIEETFEEIAADNELADAKGVQLGAKPELPPTTNGKGDSLPQLDN